MKHSPWTQEMLEKAMEPLKELKGSDESVLEMLNETAEEPDEDGNEDWFEDSIRKEIIKQVVGKTIGFVVLTGVIFLVWTILE